MRRIIHIDMDAFYASVAQRDDPALRGRPVVVGGSPQGRGVVAAASYEARRFGVRSAMPCARAARLCPQAVFVRPDFEKYREISRQMREILAGHTDRIEPLSLDECYLDVSDGLRRLPTATATAVEIRRQIRAELGLTASAGVSSLKFVAKIASDFRKPDGLTVVPPDRVLDFIHPLPVRKLWGVGPATEARLKARGIETIGALAAVPEAEVRGWGSHGRFLWGLARGEDPREVKPHRVRKSRSAETTFAQDVRDLEVLRGVLAGQATTVCEALRKAGLQGRTVTLKVRYADFTTVTRAETLSEPTWDPEVLIRAAALLLDRTEAATRPVRLVGVGLANLDPPATPAQLDLPLG